MIVITSGEFRTNQKSYLDKVDEGVEILIQRGKNKCYKLIPVIEDDTLMSKEEFFSKLNISLQQAKEGQGMALNSKEDIKKYLDSL